MYTYIQNTCLLSTIIELLLLGTDWFHNLSHPHRIIFGVAFMVTSITGVVMACMSISNGTSESSGILEGVCDVGDAISDIVDSSGDD